MDLDKDKLFPDKIDTGEISKEELKEKEICEIIQEDLIKPKKYYKPYFATGQTSKKFTKEDWDKATGLRTGSDGRLYINMNRFKVRV